ncbi:RnfABCDGE type electron transport complex subunit D [Puniceibacterium confluentis]|uniref:RnfABCDGE type electron transport complex subunit D n=1 Tax=Puniceibacterium confluentis TaxID=1958944 RepID=UPI0011B52E25|nr:RnfABCDGE type electron transport complex subunit D [Puniceibacterium confluentis]
MSQSEPLLPCFWKDNRLTAVWAVAALAPVVAAVAERSFALLVPLVLVLGLAGLWQVAFARLRNRVMGWDGIVTAMIFVLLVPVTAPLWQLGLSLSFGLVMGDLVFGGRGRGFLSPATVGLAFLLFSFPEGGAAEPGMATTLAAVGSGAVLLAASVLSWRVVAGFFIAMAALAVPWAMPDEWPALPGATLILGLVFLIGDPVAAACTNAGRWAYGLLAGALVLLFGHEGGGILSSMVFAALLASIFAPLIDQVVIWANIRRRARRRCDV